MTHRRAALLLLALAAAVSGGACDPQRHAAACGPEAASETLGRLGRPATPAEVSRGICRPGNPGQAARNVLAVLSPAANAITWPGEMLEALRRHGCRVDVVTGPHEALVAEACRVEAAGGCGVVLLHKRGTLDHWHYMAFPPASEDAAHHYGDRTVFDRLYVVRLPEKEPER